MFRPTLEQLEQREVCSANLAFAGFQDAGPQVATALVKNEALKEGVFEFFRAAAESSHVVSDADGDPIGHLYAGVGALNFDRTYLNPTAIAIAATYAGDVNFNGILIGMQLPA